MNILHIDDMSLVRRSIGRTLEIAGHKVTSVATLAEAKELVQKADVILCDGNLQTKNDGYRWAEARHQEGYPIGVLTAQPTPQFNVPALDKGTSTEELLAFVNSLAKPPAQ